MWSYTCTPENVYIAWYLVKHRDNFTCTFTSELGSFFTVSMKNSFTNVIIVVFRWWLLRPDLQWLYRRLVRDIYGAIDPCTSVFIVPELTPSLILYYYILFVQRT
jgi:hypothetical protein